MALDKPTIEEILTNSDERFKSVLESIDGAMECMMKRDFIVKTMALVYGQEEETLRYGMAYISYKMPTEEEKDYDDDDDDDIEAIVWPNGYRLYYELNYSRTELSVEGIVQDFRLT